MEIARGRVYKVEIIKEDLDIGDRGGGGGGGGGRNKLEIARQGARGGGGGECEDGRGGVWKSERGSIKNRDLRGRVESGDSWGMGWGWGLYKVEMCVGRGALVGGGRGFKKCRRGWESV